MDNDSQPVTFLNNRTEADIYLMRNCSSAPDSIDGTQYSIESTTIEPEVSLFDDVKAWRVRGVTKKAGTVQAGLLGDYGYYLTQDGVLLKRGADGPYENGTTGLKVREEAGERYKNQYKKAGGSA